MSRRWLIVRFSAIGDCVMAAHVPTAIRLADPSAYIAWAVESRCSAVVDSERLLDLKQEFPRDRWKKQRWSPRAWREQLALFARLRRERFDFGLDLQGHSKTALCLYLAKPQQRAAIAATDSLARRLNPIPPGDGPDLHLVERMMQVLNEFGEFEIPQGPIMPDLAEERRLAAGLLGSDDGPLVTISTGAGATNKQYPPDKWREVGAHFLQRGCRIALLGAGPDPKVELAGAINLVGKSTLGQTAAVLSLASLHLSGDTGAGHIAAAYGKPVVSIFGPTNPKRFRPYSPNVRVLRESDNPADVPVHTVISAGEALLEEHGQALPH